MTKQLDEFAGSVAVVVSSCDAFFDCWRPFAFFFRKFWGDCPFPVYLLTNKLDVRSDFIRAIRVGDDKGWASNMQIAIQQIATPYILYFQEDYLLTGAVNRQQLASDFSSAMENNVASFSFCDLSLLEPDFAHVTEPFAVIPKDSKGRTRLQVTLWKREALAATLKPGETAWDMEAFGSERTRELLMMSYARNAAPPFSYLMSGIVRGLWTPEAIALCRQHDLPIQPAFRPRLVDGKWNRRWRRAVGRSLFALALAQQRSKPVELDIT